MAKKQISKTYKNELMNDFGKWNFVIFLTLALMLIAMVASVLRTVNVSSLDARSKAAYQCPTVKLPSDCQGRIIRGTDSNSCITYVCTN
jgi:hypothetical protein